jgi:RNA polymerase sigma-70 factor, ECF subfamily
MTEEIAAAAGKKLFEQLVKDNMKRAYFTALGLTGSHDIAMELSQEAFIRAYRSFERFDISKNFFTWYYRILKNLCLNYKRDRKRRREFGFLEVRRNFISEDPSGVYEKEEMNEKLSSALLLLDVNEREIIILREFEDMDYSEISEVLGIPEGTVMSRLFYARKKLGNIMRSMI